MSLDVEQCIPKNLATVTEAIRATEEQYGRINGSVTLLAVSKRKPASSIRIAVAAGQLDFGENYVDEALGKIAELTDLGCIWHYIGAIQSNKTKMIAEQFSWVHGIDRVKIAARLSAQRPPKLPPINCCIQFKYDPEASKAGADLRELPEICACVDELPNLNLRGLMVIPSPRHDWQEQVAAFAKIKEIFSQLRSTHRQMDTLSMGMSDDMRAAISEGSTMVRIGTAIFGARD